MGVPPAHQHLLEEGWSVNRKRVQRVWREEGLRVPQRRRKRQRLGESTVPGDRLRAERPDHVWAFDFQFDLTADGRIVKLLHVVDEFTREALAMEAERRIDADRVVDVLERDRRRARPPPGVRPLRQRPGDDRQRPQRLVPVLPDRRGVHRARQPVGEPVRRESFDSRVRDELLSVELFSCLTEAKVMIEDFRQDYNRYRPHRAHGMMTPAGVQDGLGDRPRRPRPPAPNSAALRAGSVRAGGSPTLQEPTNHQLSQQVDR